MSVPCSRAFAVPFKENFMEPVNRRPKDRGLGFEELSQLPDPELIALLQAGHNDALAVLFDRYHRLILSVAFKILRDPAEAEDVMQSVFLEVYRVAGQFESSRGSAKVWLLQYAYHRSMNRREYLRVRGIYGGEYPHRQQSPTSDAPNREAPSHEVSHPEARCMVREAMESLSQPQQAVLHMAYFEDMPLKDIAVTRGESLGNVRHHYYRALRRLRSLFSAGESSKSPGRAREAQFEIASRGSVDVEI
jgi:RNA polymerase sigma-70 factor (ECF subfamily)